MHVSFFVLARSLAIATIARTTLAPTRPRVLAVAARLVPPRSGTDAVRATAWARSRRDPRAL